MSSVTNEIAIGRPIDDVFAALTDPEHLGTWFPGDIEEHWTSPPPHGLGSTRHAVVTMFGRRTENDAIATEYVPPSLATMRGTSKHAPFLVTIRCREDGRLTRVEVTSEILIRGGLRIPGRLFTALYGRMWARGLANLKRLMESGAL